MQLPSFLEVAVPLLAGYLLGSIPMAFMISRARGVSILDMGTRNPGAANVFRSVGRRLGALVFMADLLKGLGAVVIAWLVADSAAVMAASGVAAVLGHWYPLFLKFRGGVGLATAIGVAIGLAPVPSLAGLAIGLLSITIIRNTGAAAGIGYAVFLSVSLFRTPWTLTMEAVVLTLLMFFVMGRNIIPKLIRQKLGKELELK